jgi:hypothetical protein
LIAPEKQTWDAISWPAFTAQPNQGRRFSHFSDAETRIAGSLFQVLVVLLLIGIYLYKASRDGTGNREAMDRRRKERFQFIEVQREGPCIFMAHSLLQIQIPLFTLAELGFNILPLRVLS